MEDAAHGGAESAPAERKRKRDTGGYDEERVKEENSAVETNASAQFVLRCEVSMPARTIKRFSSAIHALAKIGKEIYIELSYSESSASMVIRTMNDARTAFCSFSFSGPCFETFHFPQTDSERGQQQLQSIGAKLPLKPLIGVFRSTRSVDRLLLSFVDQGPRHVIAFTSHCKYGVVKSHRFFYEQCDAMQPVFSSRDALHRISTRAASLLEALQHMGGTNEICLDIRPAGINVSSYFQDVGDGVTTVSRLRSDLTIPRDDFDAYDVRLGAADDTLHSQNTAISNQSTASAASGVRLIFGMREFRALLQFCGGDASGSVALLFRAPGLPILLTTDVEDPNFRAQSDVPPSGASRKHFCAELVMATLPESPGVGTGADASQVSSMSR